MAPQPQKGLVGMSTPPVAPPEAWEAARRQMLVKEKAPSGAIST